MKTQPSPPFAHFSAARQTFSWLAVCLLVALAACSGAPDSLTPSSTPSTPAGTSAGTPTRTPRPARTSTFTPAAQPFTPTPAVTLPAADLQNITIQFWHPLMGESQVFLDLITREFNQTNLWGITVENTPLSGFGELNDALQTAAQSKSLPDVWPMLTYQASELGLTSYLLDLIPYLADPRYGLTPREQADFLPALWNQDLLPDPQSPALARRVGIPWYRDGVMFLYNLTWARQLGFSTPPDSPDEFRAQACAAARSARTDSDRQNDGTGGWLLSGDPGELVGWVAAFGGEIYQPALQAYTFETPGSQQAAEFIHALAVQQCAWLAPDELLPTAFDQRRALFTAVSLSQLAGLESDFTSSDQWTVLPFPSLRAAPAVVSYGPSLMIAASTPQRQLAAWLFVRWLVSGENQARWAQFNHVFPTRQGALLNGNAVALPDQAWRQSMQFYPNLRAEPNHASWEMVRWSLQDALNQLFAPGLQAEQIPTLLKNLDDLADEIRRESP
jgi:ABC-type glycerol-3-phosphate transport system substrate-binding protein